MGCGCNPASNQQSCSQTNKTQVVVYRREVSSVVIPRDNARHVAQRAYVPHSTFCRPISSQPQFRPVRCMVRGPRLFAQNAPQQQPSQQQQPTLQHDSRSASSVRIVTPKEAPKPVTPPSKYETTAKEHGLSLGKATDVTPEQLQQIKSAKLPVVVIKASSNVNSCQPNQYNDFANMEKKGHLLDAVVRQAQKKGYYVCVCKNDASYGDHNIPTLTVCNGGQETDFHQLASYKIYEKVSKLDAAA